MSCNSTRSRPPCALATAQTLTDIAAQCDGIRCDMAMLMTNQVFAMTWVSLTGREPGEEFWPAVIAGLRIRHPQTVLVAEAYWDTEWTLQQQGFDFCYVKRLYDRILGRDVSGVRDHLRADLAYQSRLVRFLENHDEPRIAAELPRRRRTGRGGGYRHPPGCHLVARGTVRGPASAPAGLPVAPARRVTRRQPGGLVPAAAGHRRQPPGPGGRLAAARGRRLARQRFLP